MLLGLLIAVPLLILCVCSVTICHKREVRRRAIEAQHDETQTKRVRDAIDTQEEIHFPAVVLRVDDFLTLGCLKPHEEVIASHASHPSSLLHIAFCAPRRCGPSSTTLTTWPPSAPPPAPPGEYQRSKSGPCHAPLAQPRLLLASLCCCLRPEFDPSSEQLRLLLA